MDTIKLAQRLLGGGVGLLVATAAPASAQPEDDLPEDQRLVTGVAVSVGGGVAAFAQGPQRDFLGTAGIWDARVAVGTRWPVAVELAYVGSAQTIDRLGLDDDATLLSNGAEAVVRLNLMTGSPVMPYLHGGATWRRYTIMNSDRNTSDVLDEDDVFELPFGVGLDYTYDDFIIDGRAFYRPAFDDDLVRTAEGEALDEEQDLHTLGGRVAVGMRF